VNATAAAEKAKELVVSVEPSGTVFVRLEAGQPQKLGQVWRVPVDALILPPLQASGQALPVHFLIDVDMETGRAQVFASG
jgi:hypothetical protein